MERVERLHKPPIEDVFRLLLVISKRLHEAERESLKRLNSGFVPSLGEIVRDEGYSWNSQVALELQREVPNIETATITNWESRAYAHGPKGHTVVFGRYDGEHFAFDATVAQKGGEYSDQDVEYWRGDRESIRKQLTGMYGGEWQSVYTALQPVRPTAYR